MTDVNNRSDASAGGNQVDTSYVEGVTESWQDNDPDSYRRIIFVRYPLSMTGAEILRKLEWAKWNSVERIYDGVVVKCGVKPPYIKHFLEDNQPYRIPYNILTMPDGEVIYDADMVVTTAATSDFYTDTKGGQNATDAPNQD